MKIKILNEKLKALVKTERKITHEILLLIQTLDLTKSFRELGYSSLFEYLTKEIGYSEGAAQRRISSARLINEIPQIEEGLKAGELNLTQVSLAQVAFRQEERNTSLKINLSQKEKVLNLLKNKNSYETKKILKEACPTFEIPRSQPVPGANNKVSVTLEFSESEYQEVRQLLASLSHKVADQKLETALLYWARQLKKKEISKDSGQTKIEDQSKPGYRESPPLRQWKARRKALRVSVRKTVFQKAQNQCEFVSVEGKRCESRHFLEVEHQMPVALGGGNEIDNLKVLCRNHNQLAAKKRGLGKHYEN